VLPRRLLGAPTRVREQLQGLPLGETLRWSGTSAELRWSRAA
jgi:hypothetical protein